MQIRGVIFDLDGTLANTLPICYAGFRVAYQQYTGREWSDSEIAATFGPCEQGSIQRLVPHAWEECLRLYLEVYEAEHHTCTEPFEGVETLLQWLAERKLPQAIVTGKGPGTAEISLRYLGITHYFSRVEVGSPQGSVKAKAMREVAEAWGIPTSQIAYVGDHGSDVRCSRDAGAIPIAACWAETANKTELERMEPEALFERVSDFQAWLAERL